MKIVNFCLAIFLVALPVLADTYTWVDDQGTVNFTEDLGNVPPKYRKKVRILGEEAPPPSTTNEGGEAPAAKEKGGAAARVKGAPQGAGEDGKKEIYGGKDVERWKSEFAAANAELKSSETLLSEYQDRLKDTSNMSRAQYLSIQNSIKSLENSVRVRKNRLDELKRNAEAAGVPASAME